MLVQASNLHLATTSLYLLSYGTQQFIPYQVTQSRFSQRLMDRYDLNTQCKSEFPHQSPDPRRFDASNALCALRNSTTHLAAISRSEDALNHYNAHNPAYPRMSLYNGSLGSTAQPCTMSDELCTDNHQSLLWSQRHSDLPWAAVKYRQHSSSALGGIGTLQLPESYANVFSHGTDQKSAPEQPSLYRRNPHLNFEQPPFHPMTRSPCQSFKVPTQWSQPEDTRTTRKPGSPSNSSDGKSGKDSYAWLIYRALMDADDNKLSLQEIYSWVATHTDKANNPGVKGWQNSIRHNLSMNGVCAISHDRLAMC